MEEHGRWPALDDLPGIADAVEEARSAIASVRRLPANRRGWATTAAAAAIRAARASAMLDGGDVTLPVLAGGDGDRNDDPGDGDPGGDPVGGRDRDDRGGSDHGESSGAAGTAGAEGAQETARPDPGGTVTDPVLAGSLRVHAAIGELAAVWRRAPLQALARLHMLAAADLVTDVEDLGRPRPGPAVSDRLTALAAAATGAPWTGPVLVAVVHGELLALQPFPTANGVVARAAARLAMVATGLDPQALTAPEVGFLRSGAAYDEAAEGFAAGTADGVAGWIRHVCRALEAGARETRSIVRAAGR